MFYSFHIRSDSNSSTRLKKKTLELCCDVKRRKIFVQPYVTDMMVNYHELSQLCAVFKTIDFILPWVCTLMT